MRIRSIKFILIMLTCYKVISINLLEELWFEHQPSTMQLDDCIRLEYYYHRCFCRLVLAFMFSLTSVILGVADIYEWVCWCKRTSRNSYYLITTLPLYKTFSNDSSIPICPMGRFAALSTNHRQKIKIIMGEQDSTHSRCQQNIQMFRDTKILNRPFRNSHQPIFQTSLGAKFLL